MPRRRWEIVQGRVLSASISGVSPRPLSVTSGTLCAIRSYVVEGDRSRDLFSLACSMLAWGDEDVVSGLEHNGQSRDPVANTTRPARRTRRTDHRWRPEEWERIAAYASECGMTVSEYVRRAALRATPHGRRRVHQAWAVYELARIATDLRRLLRSMSAKGGDNEVVLSLPLSSDSGRDCPPVIGLESADWTACDFSVE